MYTASGQTVKQNKTKKNQQLWKIRSANRKPILFQYRYHKTTLTDADWKKVLPEDVYEVTRNADTERPFTGKYWNTDEKGTYYCAGGNHYFVPEPNSSSCGWPSFFEQENKNSVIYKKTIRWAWNELKLFEDAPAI
jgi:hypothetical protein